MPFVSRIAIHPIKGLDPVVVTETRVLPAGALEHDRRFALHDAQSRLINGKNRPDLHRLAVSYDLDRFEVTLGSRTFSLERSLPELAGWISEILNEPVEIRENGEGGFPDDTVSPGPTFVSTPSLATVADWFALSVDQARLRFRTNVELDGVEPFWEDRLYGGTFTVGPVAVHAVNPCARCVVPSRDAQSGVATTGFQKRFAERRRATLPSTADAKLFDHTYRFAVNTRIPPSEAGKTIRLHDEVQLGEP